MGSVLSVAVIPLCNKFINDGGFLEWLKGISKASLIRLTTISLLAYSSKALLRNVYSIYIESLSKPDMLNLIKRRKLSSLPILEFHKEEFFPHYFLM
jgi:hypothetical protein